MQPIGSASDWLNTVAAKRQQQWPTVDPQRLDDLALELWSDARLRAMPPERAADEWLAPVKSTR